MTGTGFNAECISCGGPGTELTEVCSTASGSDLNPIDLTVVQLTSDNKQICIDVPTVTYQGVEVPAHTICFDNLTLNGVMSAPGQAVSCRRSIDWSQPDWQPRCYWQWCLTETVLRTEVPVSFGAAPQQDHCDGA
eukprot:GDKI01039362.1.p1 GENE.GDKI01039362.1~~GDKI01039362.1.p1  ORF type:complete len:151 (+),score=23.31 GDKI01039362.1:49-453(+)